MRMKIVYIGVYWCFDEASEYWCFDEASEYNPRSC